MNETLSSPSTLTVLSTPTAVLASPAPSASNPCQGFACGIITGYVYDRQTDKPLSGATVQAESNGQNCPIYVCAPNITTAGGPNGAGYFKVIGPALAPSPSRSPSPAT